MSHITGAHSSLVFQTCLPLLGPDHLRTLVTTLLSGLIPADLDKLANHRSMEVMVTQAGSIDKQSLFLIAMDMERRNVLLTEEYHYLVSLLLRFGGGFIGVFISLSMTFIRSRCQSWWSSPTQCLRKAPLYCEHNIREENGVSPHHLSQ